MYEFVDDLQVLFDFLGEKTSLLVEKRWYIPCLKKLDLIGSHLSYFKKLSILKNLFCLSKLITARASISSLDKKDFTLS